MLSHNCNYVIDNASSIELYMNWHHVHGIMVQFPGFGRLRQERSLAAQVLGASKEEISWQIFPKELHNQTNQADECSPHS